MPPKKGKKSGKKSGKKGKAKGKGKGKGKNSAAGASAAGNGAVEDVFVDKEELLHEELAKVTNNINAIKQEIVDTKRECDFLQDEAQKIRVESHEYMSYMEKKIHKRQRCLITLNDYNQQEICDLKELQKKMVDAYEAEKQKLRAEILDKASKLSSAHQEIDDMDELMRFKNEQTSQIAALENEVQSVRSRHSEQLNQLKMRFVQERCSFEEEAERRVQELAKEAFREAVICLVGHTNQIKLDNRSLRKELLSLIQQTRNLQVYRSKLEDQHTELLREQQFARDLRNVRDSKNRRIYRALGGGAVGANVLLCTDAELQIDHR